jgi:hypothetical protein
MAEVIKAKFLREFQRNLFSDNSFWMKAKSDSGADDNETINIPQAAGKVGSTFGLIQAGQVDGDNANSLTPKVRLNDKKSYDIEVFGTEAVALQLADLDTISYNKRQELFREHQDVISQDIADFAAVQYAQDTPNASLIIESTGTDLRANIVTGGFVGNVRKFTKADIINVKRIFHRMNLAGIPGKIYGLITPEQWEDLLLIADFVDYEKMGQESKLKEGVIGRLLGIDFMIPRHNEALNANVVYDAALAKRAYGAALTATETSAGIFFHSGLVRYSKGRGYIYETKKDPVYKSDIMSADARFGATKSRSDGRGVVSLVEAQTP